MVLLAVDQMGGVYSPPANGQWGDQMTSLLT